MSLPSAYRCLATILGLLWLSGCVASKPTAEGGDVAATATPAPATSESSTPIFPHASGWKAAASHGAAARHFGQAACLQCHASADPWNTAPTCRSCHAEYPHRDDWVQPTQHGAFVRAKGKAACATQCHGTDLQGGLSGVSCTTCHTLYPHAATWREPEQHGQLAKWGGRVACQGCHGEDLAGGSSGVSCTQCHVRYPHPNAWAEREQHGVWVSSHTSTDCATGCHGTDLGGGRTGVSCTGCHQTYPHRADWATPEQHGAVAQTLGQTECARCHGDDFRTVLGGKNCFTCHADYPHPASAVWRPFGGGHGERVQQGYDGNTDECQRCHGATLERELNGKTCYSCHPSYPHRGTETAPWKAYAGHGASALAASTTECALCHGASLHGELQGKPSCSSSDAGCHAVYPHGAAWALSKGLPQEHAEYVQANGFESCGTVHCHGVDLQVESKITVGPSCGGCHDGFPHPAGWESGLFHGPSARADIDGCKSCHGPQLNIVLGGKPTCEGCHASYLVHDSAAIAPQGWGLLSGHGSFLLALADKTDRYTKIAECRMCHGPKNNSIGVPKKTCGYATCHASYPHEDPQWGALGAAGEPPLHVGYIKDTLQGKLDPCRMCHGAALDGGHAQQSCMTCHPGYPHASGWVAPKGASQQHAAQIQVGGLGSCGTVKCHGENLQVSPGVTAGPSCSKCHETLPHPEGWASGLVHGPSALTDIDSCKACHGSQLNVALGGKPSCEGCHASYLAHDSAGIAAPGWGQFSGHGATLMAMASKADRYAKITECQLCHGVKEDAIGVTKKTCASASCHASYPHDDPQWGVVGAAGEPPLHVDYIKDTLLGKLDPCRVCHGAALDGGHAQQSCMTCHPDYPHPAGWARAWNTKAATLSGHGPAFTKQATAMGAKDPAQSVTCWECHDQPVLFNSETDTKASLQAKGDCYTCHWSYPHWQITESWLVREWEPAITYSTDANGQPCGSAKLGVGTQAHFVAIVAAPFLVNSAGKSFAFAWEQIDSVPYVAYTCGGGVNGSCHMSGYRSAKHGGTGTCTQYCHNATLAPLPVYPDCPVLPTEPLPEE
ncbi:MAG: hypothetical protein HY696_08410 [Deltaproteobacteria bacterium]|nr:hypothetical protein [Deltaproteobacteria bacterium]